jgi:hypothetical protein
VFESIVCAQFVIDEVNDMNVEVMETRWAIKAGVARWFLVSSMARAEC